MTSVTHIVQLIIQTYHDSNKLDDYVNNYDNNGAKKDEGVSEKHSYHYQVEERKWWNLIRLEVTISLFVSFQQT